MLTLILMLRKCCFILLHDAIFFLYTCLSHRVQTSFHRSLVDLTYPHIAIVGTAGALDSDFMLIRSWVVTHTNDQLENFLSKVVSRRKLSDA